MESILGHSGHMNPKPYLPRPRRCGRNMGRLGEIHTVDRTLISVIGCLLNFHMTLHISRCDNDLILMTSHLIRNEPLEHEIIVVWSVTRYKISYQSGGTTYNRDSTINSDVKITHTILVLGLIAAVDLLIRRSGNWDVTNWWTNLEGRSNTEIRVTIGDSGSGINIWII